MPDLTALISLSEEAEAHVLAVLRKKHPLLPPHLLSATELEALRQDARDLLDQLRGGNLPAEFRAYLSGFYSARSLGENPYHTVLPPTPKAKREQARRFLHGREILGAIFSAFPEWRGDLPPSETAQWYWLVRLWGAAQEGEHPDIARSVASGLAAMVGALIGLNDTFQSGYASLFARGGIGAALLKFDLDHAHDEKTYRELQRRLGFPLRRRLSALGIPPPKRSQVTGKELVRQEFDELDPQLGEVMAEWLRRPLEETLAEFDKLRFASRRLQDRVRDIWRGLMAQKRGASVPRVSTARPISEVGTGEDEGKTISVEDTLVDQDIGTTPAEVESRFIDPLVAQEWVAKVSGDYGKKAGKIAAVFVQSGPSLPIQEIAQEAGCDRKTVGKYLPKLEAHLRRFNAS